MGEIEYNEQPPSTITPGIQSDIRDIKDSAKDIHTFFERLFPSASLKVKEGSSISVSSKYTATDYVTDMCTAIHMYISKYNTKLTPDDKVFFKQYMESLTGLCKMFKKFDFNVADPEFFAYIFSYNLKIITEYYGTSKYR